MSPERKRRYIEELVPDDRDNVCLVDVRFCDNPNRAFGYDKPYIVYIQEITFDERGSMPDEFGDVAWRVSRKSIDLYCGGGSSYPTLEQARAMFDQWVAASGCEPTLF